MLALMKRINRVPDFSIYVTNPRHPGSKMLKEGLAAYEAEFSPATRANIVVTVGA